jgi:cag pathogenicity island protein 24
LNFRKLTEDELEELKEEFVQYLVANGVDAELWEQLKKDEPEKANLFIQQFSNIVLRKSLEKIEYLEHRTPSDVKLFYCGKEAIDLIAIKSSVVDLTNIAEFNAEEFKNIEIFKATKSYSKNREVELFEMTEKGCQITTHTLYDLLKQMV